MSKSYVGIVNIVRLEYAKAQSDIATTEVDKMTLPKAWLSGIKELKNMITYVHRQIQNIFRSGCRLHANAYCPMKVTNLRENRKKGGDEVIPYIVRAVETDSVASLRRDSQCLQGAEIKGVVRYHPQGGR